MLRKFDIRMYQLGIGSDIFSQVVDDPIPISSSAFGRNNRKSELYLL